MPYRNRALTRNMIVYLKFLVLVCHIPYHERLSSLGYLRILFSLKPVRRIGLLFSA